MWYFCQMSHWKSELWMTFSYIKINLEVFSVVLEIICKQTGIQTEACTHMDINKSSFWWWLIIIAFGPKLPFHPLPPVITLKLKSSGSFLQKNQFFFSNNNYWYVSDLMPFLTRFSFTAMQHPWCISLYNMFKYNYNNKKNKNSKIQKSSL